MDSAEGGDPYGSIVAARSLAATGSKPTISRLDPATTELRKSATIEIRTYSPSVTVEV